MIKLKLTLQPPKKWERPNYVTQDDIDQYEYLIYNDLDVKRKIDKDIPKYNFEWVDKYLVEDEEWVQMAEPLETYCITSFGRVFSSNRKRPIKPIKVRNNFYITLKGESVVFRREFFKNDWTYSPSLISQKYKQYGWSYLKSKKDELDIRE